MKVISTREQLVYAASGQEEEGRFIDKGDLCELGGVTDKLLIAVTYPTAKGPRSAFVKSLEGFVRA